jgi:hypothetical protein
MKDVIEAMAEAMCARPERIKPDAASMGQDGFIRPAVANRMIELRAALSAAAERGWKLVPVEPTEEMQHAGARVFTMAKVYSAMIAASPEAK